jgi:hypothetical protein
MKSYPSIPKTFQEFDAYVFDKIDGSNLRFEWSKKQKWHKFGTRSRLFDQSDEIFGCAIPRFKETLADQLEKIAIDNRWESVIVFCEFWGETSFAGTHEPTDDKYLTLFDIAPFKKGILGPKEFLKLTKDIKYVPKFFGIERWTRGFVQRVYDGEYNPGITFEGIVGKAGSGHDLVMAKAKTAEWIREVYLRFAEKADQIVES